MTHELVMRLMGPLLGQGYCVYVDKFYTSGPLFEELFQNATLAVGTVWSGRQGYPKELKDMKEWSKSVERGNRQLQFALTCIVTSVPQGLFTTNKKAHW